MKSHCLLCWLLRHWTSFKINIEIFAGRAAMSNILTICHTARSFNWILALGHRATPFSISLPANGSTLRGSWCSSVQSNRIPRINFSLLATQTAVFGRVRGFQKQAWFKDGSHQATQIFTFLAIHSKGYDIKWCGRLLDVMVSTLPIKHDATIGTASTEGETKQPRQDGLRRARQHSNETKAVNPSPCSF